jgi:hypothetical protein
MNTFFWFLDAISVPCLGPVLCGMFPGLGHVCAITGQ